MNPHFIYNCLNTLKVLIRTGEKQNTTTYLTTFSKLIRALFQNSDKQKISLYDEIENCKLYTQLESIHFGNKIKINFRIDSDLDLKSVMVPALIVQPFIENAIELRAIRAFTTWSRAYFDGVSLVSLHPADGVARALWVAPSGSPTPTSAVLSQDLWDWSEVRSGIATISSSVAESFVPQMLNYESVGGVNFKKGCYPGREVVARSQFRGTLKRRAYLAHCASPMKVGEEVFSSDDQGQPVGTVAQTAAAPTSGFDAIVSMQISAFEAGGVRLGAVDGPPLMLSPPPYPLLADI